MPANVMREHHEGPALLALGVKYIIPKNKTRAELSMLTRRQYIEGGPSVMYRADVKTRRKKGETFEVFLIRAAEMVVSGHLPKVRVPRPKPLDQCSCGRRDDLVWQYQLKQRVCRRCAALWEQAARSNDMRPVSGDVQ